MSIKFLKEVFNFSIDDIKSNWGLFATLFGLISVLIPDIRVYVGLFALFFIRSCWILFISFTTLRKKIIDVDPRPNRNFYIMIDDFIDNFKYNLENLDVQGPPLSVAVGFDRSLQLSNTSSGSMLEDFLKYLEIEHNVTQQDLQEKIDEARKLQGILNPKLGDILHVPISLSGKRVILLFVINSQKKEVTSIMRNDLLKGEDSRIIIIKLFKKCKELELNTLMLGAIGTNKLEFPYKIIVTEIINAYIYCVEKKYNPKKVYLSLREQDMKEQSLEKREIIHYIAQSIKFNVI